MSAPEPYASKLLDEHDQLKPTTVMMLDATDFMLLADFHTLNKINEVAAVVRKTRAAVAKRREALFEALQVRRTCPLLAARC